MADGNGSSDRIVATGGETAVPGGNGPAISILASCPELLVLLATARRELDRHVSDDQHRCQVCGDDWPCERAALAAFTLGAL